MTPDHRTIRTGEAGGPRATAVVASITAAAGIPWHGAAAVAAFTRR